MKHGHPKFYIYIEEIRKRLHSMVDSIVDEMIDLHDRKNADYAGDHDPLFNFTISWLYGLPDSIRIPRKRD